MNSSSTLGTHPDDYFPPGHLPSLDPPEPRTFSELLRRKPLSNLHATVPVSIRLHAIYRAARFVYGLLELVVKVAVSDPDRVAHVRELRSALALELRRPDFLASVAYRIVVHRDVFSDKYLSVFVAATNEKASQEDKTRLFCHLNPILHDLSMISFAPVMNQLVRQFAATEARFLAVCLKPSDAVDTDTELQSRTRLAYWCLTEPGAYLLRPASTAPGNVSCLFVPSAQSGPSDC